MKNLFPETYIVDGNRAPEEVLGEIIKISGKINWSFPFVSQRYDIHLQRTLFSEIPKNFVLWGCRRRMVCETKGTQHRTDWRLWRHAPWVL